ncbi:MAG: hypothetical protein MJE12_26645 [Alphaproteobacteria bacterium]|nr:hypothetical protein [Alphaproteobacteria bacterium]
MESPDILRQYGWVLAVGLVLVFLLMRFIMRRIRQRREERARLIAERTGETPLVGPDGFKRARQQFILTAALLVVIVILAVLTHLQ